MSSILNKATTYLLTTFSFQQPVIIQLHSKTKIYCKLPIDVIIWLWSFPLCQSSIDITSEK